MSSENAGWMRKVANGESRPPASGAERVTDQRRGLAYAVPLSGFMAQIVVPSDLTDREAERLSAFLRTVCTQPLNSDGGDA